MVEELSEFEVSFFLFKLWIIYLMSLLFRLICFRQLNLLNVLKSFFVNLLIISLEVLFLFEVIYWMLDLYTLHQLIQRRLFINLIKLIHIKKRFTFLISLFLLANYFGIFFICCLCAWCLHGLSLGGSACGCSMEWIYGFSTLLFRPRKGLFAWRLVL